MLFYNDKYLDKYNKHKHTVNTVRLYTYLVDECGSRYRGVLVDLIEDLELARVLNR